MKLGSYAIIGLSLLGSRAFGADTKVEELLSHMRRAYSSVLAATFRTTFVETDEIQGKPTKTTLDFDIAYKKPNMIRAIISGKFLPSTATVLSDGHTMTINVAGGESSAKDFTIDAFESQVPVNLESISFWDSDRQLSTAPGKNMEKSTFKIVNDEQWNGKHWIVLEETAAKDKELCRYFIDPKTYLIWRTNVKDLDTKEDKLDSMLTEMNPNADLSDTLFIGT